jgi:CheY-like chemotaxis protein
MVVDDDIDFLTQMRTQLERGGDEVVTFDSAAAARTALAHEKPDMVLVDIMMETPDAGLALCHHIKKLDPGIPVVIVSAVARETDMNFHAETDEERAWVKADAFLAKPLRYEQLQREMQRLLKSEKVTK